MHVRAGSNVGHNGYCSVEMNWEFKYVRLEMEPEYSQDEAYERRVAVIAQFGNEGWEPVGEVTFSHVTPVDPESTPSPPTQLRRLMFKRPIPERAVEAAPTRRARGRRSK
jgi:hypothetical protein